MKSLIPFCLLLSVLLLAACSAQQAQPPTLLPTFTPSPSATVTVNPTQTPSPTMTLTPAPSFTPTPALAVCSPLEGYALEDLSAMISNAYHPPEPGLDDPHHGVDLAIMAPDSRIALPGNTVLSALPGQVVAVQHDRFPYGSAIIIETPLELASPDWWAAVELPTPAPTLAPRSALTCPPLVEPLNYDANRRSLYVLYAHLATVTDLQPGQEITCSQPLGTVGDSGNALNPHLHFEVRSAPSGIPIKSMAHYDDSASSAEMSTYCLWRVSGLFQFVDPMKLLSR